MYRHPRDGAVRHTLHDRQEKIDRVVLNERHSSTPETFGWSPFS